MSEPRRADVRVVVTHDAVWWDGTDDGWDEVISSLAWDDCMVYPSAKGRAGQVWTYGSPSQVRPGWLVADPVIENAEDCGSVIEVIPDDV